MRTFDAVLVMADISGYTRFVVMHRTSLVHAEQIVSELLEAVTSSSKFPLKIQKLEGDAVFFSAEITGLATDVVNDVVRQIMAFMIAFRDKKEELFNASLGGCKCSACQSVELLQLKAIVHHGTIVEKDVSGLRDLAGEAVILVHRLSKNDVEGDDYLLLTDTTASLLDFEPYPFKQTYRQEIEDLGSVNIVTYYPSERQFDRGRVRPFTRVSGMLEAIRLFVARGILKLKRGKRKFRNLPT